jgi:hypothetical protein
MRNHKLPRADPRPQIVSELTTYCYAKCSVNALLIPCQTSHLVTKDPFPIKTLVYHPDPLQLGANRDSRGSDAGIAY